MQLEDLDLSTKRVNIGALNVIGGFSGTSVDDIKTAIVSTLGATQSLSSSMKAFIADIMDDGMISPIEKKQLKRELALIQNEFPIICTKALEAGVPEADPVMIAYTEAYEGLYGYLYNELKVFDDMSAFTVVADTAEFEAHFTTYYAARDEVETSITDGLLLEVLNTVAADIEDVNQRIDDVRNGDVIDGAFARSKLESGLQTEISQVSSAIFPNGLDRQNTFELLTPRVALNEDMADYLLSLIGDQEEMVEVRANEIRLVSARADSDRTRISSLEIDLDSITQIVAELTPLADGQIANLTQITQNASAIELLATTGRYDTGSGEVDSYSLAQMNLLADRFELFVGGSGTDFDAATWKVTQDQIGSLVQNAIETDDDLIASISQMVQAADSVQFQVAQLRTETIERVDEALMLAQGGMLITATEIQLGVQNLEDELQAILSIQAGQINALVQDVAKNSSSILSLKSEQIAALVRGGGAEAYLSLSVTLPATIDANLRNTMITAVGAAAVNEVYVLTTSGYWYVSPDATSVALKTLKNGLRAAGLLGSQIALDADEILMGGKVLAENIDVTDLAADEAFIEALSVQALHVDTNPDSETDFEVLIDKTNGILAKKNSNIILHIDPATGDAIFAGIVNASGGHFTGSIESGPLVLNINPPGMATVPTTGKTAAALIDELINFGLKSGTKYNCTGLYSGINLGAVEVWRSSYDETLSASTYWYVNEDVNNSSDYKRRRYRANWRGIRSRTTYTIIFYDSNNVEIALLTDETAPASVSWSLLGSTYLDYSYGSWATPTAPVSPGDTTAIPADVYCSTGSITYTAEGYTFLLRNMPEYSGALPPGSLYRSGNAVMIV